MRARGQKIKTLIVGGSGETASVAGLLVGRDAVLLWPGVGPGMDDFGIAQTHLLHFNAKTLQATLVEGGFTHLLDVSHGFEDAISRDAAEAAAQAGVPYVFLRRPAWQPKAGDVWTDARDMAQACDAIAAYRRVFTNVGRGLLPDLRGFGGDLFVRQTQCHDDPPILDNAVYAFGVPPFDQRTEEALLRDLAIDAVLFRNTGGDAGASKVRAARARRLPMIMLERPAPPDGLRLSSLNEVRAWIKTL